MSDTGTDGATARSSHASGLARVTDSVKGCVGQSGRIDPAASDLQQQVIGLYSQVEIAPTALQFRDVHWRDGLFSSQQK